MATHVLIKGLGEIGKKKFLSHTVQLLCQCTVSWCLVYGKRLSKALLLHLSIFHPGCSLFIMIPFRLLTLDKACFPRGIAVLLVVTEDILYCPSIIQ